MSKRTVVLPLVLLFGIIAAGLAINRNYFYVYLLAVSAPKYPTGEIIDNLVVYQIDPETILTSLEEGNSSVFLPATKNPIYEDVAPLTPISFFRWSQEDSLQVANALHQFVWGEPLNDWRLYSAGFTIPQCKDITKINGAGFRHYQRQKDWYFVVHDINIDLEYGYVYAGDNNGYYTGKWEDIDVSQSAVKSADQALHIAEDNGGEEARLVLSDDQECHISIFLSPHALFDRTWDGWGWEVTYWTKDGSLLLYGIIIDPYTGKYEILAANQ